MILITGSTGNFGRAVIDFLLHDTSAKNITALARDRKKAEDLKAKGVNVVLADYDDYDSLTGALGNAEKVLLISGNNVGKRSRQHENVINAAKQAGVKHIVYTSFYHPTGKTSSLGVVAESHLETEEHLKDSGMSWTIMQNILYAEMLPLFFGPAISKTGIYLPAGEGKAAFATRENMAEAAARILLSEGHENKEYEIANTHNYSFHDAASYLSQITGCDINYYSPQVEEFSKTLSQAGVSKENIQISEAFCQAIKNGELHATSTDLDKLIGRRPTSLYDFLLETYEPETAQPGKRGF